MPITTRRRVLHWAASTLAIAAGIGNCTPLGAQTQPPTADATALPTELHGLLEAARWSGNARLQFFGLDIYVANLWVSPGFDANTYAHTPFALELRYLRSLYGSAIARRALQEMEHVGPITDAQQRNWLAAMLNAFPDVRDGDRLLGLHQPGIGARFWHNGVPRAAIADTEFSRYFFGIWLAASSSEPALRTRLLTHAPS